MAKLWFRHGSVGSAKTLNLLSVAHQYEEQDKKILLAKPSCDTRFGLRWVKSRAGLQREADVLLDDDTEIPDHIFEGCHCLLVDEAQFLSPFIIDQLRHIASGLRVPVIAYGLRSDFRSHLFPGSKRLLELADKIEEVKSTCRFCNSKAMMSLKKVDGVGTLDGASVALGCEELYVPVCYPHFFKKTQLSEEVGGLPGALALGRALERASKRGKVEDGESADHSPTAALENATKRCKVTDDEKADQSPSRGPTAISFEPDQEQTPTKSSS
jgi:thymidine kinase